MIRLLFALLLAAGNAAAEPLVLEPGIESQSGDAKIEALFGEKTLDEAIASEDWKKADTNFGYIRRPLWIRLRTASASPQDFVWMTDANPRELKVHVVRGSRRETFDLSVRRRLEDEARFLRPVLPISLEAGATDLYFEIRSDNSIQFTSDFVTPAAYEERRDTVLALYGIFFGALFLMAFYNLFVYLATRETSYRSYITYALSSFLFFFAQSGMLLMFVPGVSENVVMRFQLFMLGPYVSFMCLFARSFLGHALKGTWPDKLLVLSMAAGAVITVSSLVPAIPFRAAAGPASLFVMAALVLVLGCGISAWRKGYRPARYYTISFTAFVGGALLLALRQIGVVPHNLITSHAVQLGTLAEMALLAFALSDRINLLKRDAEVKMAELEHTNQELENSLAKYRSIFQDTSDLVFTLDEKGVFLSVNSAATKILGYSAQALTGQRLYALLYESGSLDLQSPLLDDALSGSEGVRRFRLRLASRDGNAVELSLKLERLRTARGVTFQGRAFRASADVLLGALRRERLSYSIDNYFATAELLNQRMSRNLPAFFTEEDCVDLQVVLREMLVNAIEHGNLEISYDEKTRAQQEGNFLKYAASRQKMSAYAGRRIHVISSLNRFRALFRIEDEGPGFDHAAVAARALEKMGDLTLSHGRGIAISRELLDRVTYSEKGNTVTLLRTVRKTP